MDTRIPATGSVNDHETDSSPQEGSERLREANERFELVMRGANDGLWDWDLRTGEVYFSPRWKQILGYEDHEVPNRLEEWSKRVHSDDLERALATVRAHLEGDTPYYELEHRLLHKDETYRWISARGASLRDAGGKAYRMAGAHWDITERKRAEEELRRREAGLQAIAFAGERFLQTGSAWEESIEEVLRRLGEAADVSRVYIFENYTGDDGGLWATHRYEWVAPNVSPQIDNPVLKALSYRDACLERWIGILGQGQLVYGHTRNLPEGEQPQLQADDVLSLVLVPIFVEGSWWGFIGFDECRREREWTAAERDALKAAAATLGAALGRDRAEAALRRSEEWFRSLVQNSSDIVTLIGADGEIAYQSPSIERVLGYSPERFVGADILDSMPIHPDDLPALRELFAEILPEAGATVTVEFRVRHADGSWRHIEGIGTNLLADPSVGGIVANYRDITDRKRAEEQIREKEEQYRSIFEATSDGLVINDADGYVVEANPAMCEMHGYTREEMVGLHPSAFIHPDNHRLFSEFLEQIREGGSFRTRAIDTRKDGSPFHVEVHGSQFTYMGKPHILGVIRDITERVEAFDLLERRVAERTRELSALLDVSNQVASTLDLQPLLGLILDQLRTVVDYTGAALHTLDGDDVRVVGYRGPIPEDVVFSPGFRFPSEQANRAVISTCGPVIIGDVRGDSTLARAYQERAGAELGSSYGYVRSWLGVPLKLKEQVIGMLSVVHDRPNGYTMRDAELAMAIASQAAVAIENARLYERAQSIAALEERQKLARELHDSVSQALYGIALGARTARTLLDRDPTRVAPPLDYVMSLAEAGLAEMRALIFELRPESLETEGLVAALTKQAASLRARHSIEVRTQMCDEPELPLDVKEALYRIGQEAMHNTAKHARATEVDLRLLCDSREVVLEVRDNGQGFDTSMPFPGHLGLRSMRERAGRLGGTLEIRSEPGEGTSLRAALPAGGRSSTGGS